MSGVPTKRFSVDDIAKWGRLVKSWATHLDYVSQDYLYQPPRENWVNTTWNNPNPPGQQTITDRDAHGAPKAWCLPPMHAVSIPGSDHTKVTLASAVALTVQEFTTRVNQAGVTHRLPPQYKHVIILQGGGDTMVLRLPPQDTLQSSEDDLLNGFDYVIPDFYNDLYAGQVPTTFPTAADKPALMQLHANRIGEYTLNTCN